MKDFFINLLIFVLAVVFVLGIVLIFFSVTIDFQAKLKACQEHGYDGIRFINKLNNELECANFTESEKIFREIK